MIMGRVREMLVMTLTALTGAIPSVSRAAEPEPAIGKAVERREEWRRARQPLLMNDFGEQEHFRKANAALEPPAAGERRVVFLGDSITAGWPLATFFPGKPYLNRGIGGQTTAQVLVRFRQDVVDLQPKVVVILLGTNDLAGNTGPMTIEDTEKNLASLAELARAHRIQVVFSSVTPVHDYTPSTDITFPLRPPAKIVELNRWLKTYCEANGHVYLDYYGAMVDGKGLLKKDLAADGLHPNRAGYAIMAPLAERAIGAALARVAAGH